MPKSEKAKAAIDLAKIALKASAAVLHKPGAVMLDGYPHLVYAPAQHGPGIRTENNGTKVEDIASAVSETPDYEILAARFGVTTDHVADAVRYAVAVGFAAVG